MVMNKKGFLRIMEAIIAIVLVLGFVLAVLPQKIKTTYRIPPSLDQTVSSVLEEMQKKPIFRNCVLGNSLNFDPNGNPDFTDTGNGAPPGTTPVPKIGAACVYDYLKYLSTPETTHPWNYAVKICDLPETIVPLATSPNCNYAGNEITDEQTFKDKLPKTKDVYLKITELSGPDITGINPSIPTAGTIVNPNKKLTIYAWSKQ